MTAIGCNLPSVAYKTERQHVVVDKDWPKRCLYSKLIRGLVENGNGMLKQKKEWVRSFFVGDKDRFDMVVAVDKNNHLPVYDYVVHLRTISLIEVSDYFQV